MSSYRARLSRGARPRATGTGSLVTLLVLAALFLPTAPAFAHDELLESTPADGAKLTEAPTEVQLVFGEGVQESGSAIVVQGEDGSRYDQPNTFAVEENVATVQLAKNAPAENYTVTYRIVSEDGHPVSDSFEFRVAATSSPSTSASSPSSTPSSDASPLAGTSDDNGGSTSVVWVLGLGAIGLVLVAAIIAVAVRGRRDRSD